MKEIFFLILFLQFGFLKSQVSGTLSLGATTSPCNNGCNQNCSFCGNEATGNCAVYNLTQQVTLASGETVQIIINNANCGSFGGFDISIDRILFTANGVTTLFQANSATQCFYNISGGEKTVTFGYRADRRDEFINYTYTVSSGTGSGCTLLPVQLDNFEVKTIGLNNKVSWTTSSETNNDYFTIERSSDGLEFNAIGIIDGAGNSNREIRYEFIDEKPLPGVNYYRIKQTDFDGQYSYSDIRSVRFGSLSAIQVSPGTTEGRLTITTALENYSVTIVNAAGQMMKKYSSLSLDQTINIEDLHSGLYFIRLSSGSDVETTRVIKI